MFAPPRNSALRALSTTLGVLQEPQRRAAAKASVCGATPKRCPPKTCLDPPSLCDRQLQASPGLIGPKHISTLRALLPGLGRYALAGLICISYLADWKAVLQYLPYYNGKYYDPDEEERKRKAALKKEEPPPEPPKEC